MLHKVYRLVSCDSGYDKNADVLRGERLIGVCSSAMPLLKKVRLARGNSR